MFGYRTGYGARGDAGYAQHANLGTIVANAIEAAVAANGYPSSDLAGLRAWVLANFQPGMSWGVVANPTDRIELDLQGNGTLSAWWDDASTNSYALNGSTDTVVSHTYASAANRPVVVLGDVTRWTSPDTTDGRTSYGTDVRYLPSSLTYLNVWGSNTLTGDIAALSASLTYLNVTGSNTLTGDIAALSASLTLLNVRGSNTLSGDVASLSASLTYLNVQGSNTLSGDVSALPASLTFLQVWGSTTLSGDVAGLPAPLTSLNVFGSNTLSGDVAGLPAPLTSLSVFGSNTLSGDVAGLPAPLTYLRVFGSNTLSGDVAGLPASLTFLSVGGSNTLSASLGTSAGIPTPVSYVNVDNMVSGSVDNVLEAMAANVGATKPRGERIVRLSGGSAQPRTTASDAAVATLTSASPPYTVTTA